MKLKLLAFMAILAAWGCQPSTNQQDKPQSADAQPNILWIVADDLGVDIGCYGTKAVHTPHLDQLAREGVRYENLHTTTAVCSPSRSGLITGMYPVSIDCHQHRTPFKHALPDPVQPITRYFREAGYFVTNGSFKAENRKGKTDYNFTHHFDSLYDGTHWNQRKSGQPFFSQIQIFIPHRPFLKDTLNPVDPDNVQLPPYYVDHPVTRKDWAMYLETIQLVDIEVGKILKKLEEEGLAENTIVFFFGDQGRPHMRGKQFLYDPGTNTPLIVRHPSGTGANSVSQQLISNIDIAATSMALAGITIPPHMQGQDFLGEQPERAFLTTMRDRRDETVDRIRAVRTTDFKYIRNFYPERPYTQFNAYKKFRYPVLTLMQVLYKKGELNEVQSRFMAESRPAEELYDLKNDPDEINNLAGDANYEEQLAGLRQHMDEWLVTYDLGKYPENPRAIQAAEELMKGRFKRNMESLGLNPAISDEEFLQYWEKTLLEETDDVSHAN
ncbi:sulfatase [Fulvivirgaceae bacterium BMA12]|uniref:Sulfatase n=1 Tax=Agaribacillus aureus TaxID=3051825 RepID=A0ABT8LL33_9BACT|nr:sulfatase [Fulvivirgaceae bacterium BMA12]